MGADAARQPLIASILSVGTAVPEHWILQNDSALIAQQLRLSERWNETLPKLYMRSGVARRHSVLLNESQSDDVCDRQEFYQVASATEPSGPTTADRMKAFDHHAVDLLARAACGALEKADVSVDEVTHLVTVSCSGFAAPGVDLQLMRLLGLANSVQRTNVGFMGCHGAINGLRVAKAIAESDPNATVLIGAVELCSLHQQYSDDPQQLVANSLFADGAASLVVRAHRSNDRDVTRSHSLNAPLYRDPWNVVSTGSVLLEDTSDLMSWRIGNHGFEMSLSPQVPTIIASQLREWMMSWLEAYGLSLSHVDAWAIHPGGPRIVAAAGEALTLEAEELVMSMSVLSDYGNMSSPTVLFILDRINQRMPESQTCVLIAFGPGLCVEAALLQRS